MRNPHSIRIDDKIWNQARDSGLNISKFIESNLNLHSTSKKQKIMNLLLFCFICKEKQKTIENLWTFGIKYSDKGDDSRSDYFIVCDSCVKSLKDKKRLYPIPKELRDNFEYVESIYYKCLVQHSYDSDRLGSSKEIRYLLELAEEDNYLHFDFIRGSIRLPNLKQLSKLLDIPIERLREKGNEKN
tara:strand:- start:107 stop:664 length:558 start_codon:yes stop_codon:yes gene_type:complete